MDISVIDHNNLPQYIGLLLLKIEGLEKHLLQKTGNQDAPPEIEYWTRKEVLAKLRMSAPTLRDLTSAGKIKGYRIGGRVLYIPAEVQAAVSKNVIIE